MTLPSLAVNDDNIDESNETVIIQLAGASGASIGSSTLHTYTIIDNDTSTIQFAAASSNGSEATAATTITVGLSTASALGTSIQYSVTSGTATGSGTDYTLTAGTLTIAAGATTANLPSLAVNNDNIDEANETVIIELASAVSATIGSSTLHTYTINDNDTSTIQFAAASSGGSEATAATTISVTISAVSTGNVSVQYSISGGTATGGGADYTLAAGTLTIAAGGTTFNLPTLAINDDNIDETNETIIIQLASAVNAAIGSSTLHTYTITDNDSSTIQFTSTNSNGSEATAATVISVGLNAASASAVSVQYSISGGTATGSGTDFTLASGTVTIAAGATTANLPSLAINNDNIVEVDETVIIQLAGAVNAAIGSSTLHTYTINDNDTTSIQFTASASSNSEATPTPVIQVSLTSASAQTTSVQYSVTGGTAAGAGTDYTLAAGTVTIAAGATTVNLPSLAVNNDTIAELNETVIIQLAGAVNATLGAGALHTYTINDNDTATIQFTFASSAGLENVTPANISVDLSNVSASNVSVQYSVTGGTATGSGTDFTLAAGTLTITAGASSANIVAAINNDSLVESNETIIVQLASAVNGTLGSAILHTYTITEDDIAIVQFGIASSSAAESAGIIVQVTLSNATAAPVTVQYAIAGGTATAGGVDYTLANGTLTIAAGATTAAITGAVNDDNIGGEGNETIVLELSNNSGNSTMGATTTHIYTIDENDFPAVTITQTGSDTTVSEAGQTDTYDIVLDTQPAGDVTITIAVDGQLTASTTTLIFTTGNWNIAQPVTVTAVDDTTAESNHTGTITHTAASGGDANYDSIPISSITVNIEDNDTEDYTNLDQTLIGPNPLDTGKYSKLLFHKIPTGTEVTIYSNVGKKITKFVISTYNGKFEWSLNTGEGARLPGGIYLVKMKTPQGETRIDKLILRRY